MPENKNQNNNSNTSSSNQITASVSGTSTSIKGKQKEVINIVNELDLIIGKEDEKLTFIDGLGDYLTNKEKEIMYCLKKLGPEITLKGMISIELCEAGGIEENNDEKFEEIRKKVQNQFNEIAKKLSQLKTKKEMIYEIHT